MGPLQAHFAHYIGRLLAGDRGLEAAIGDLTLDELHFRPNEHSNSIGFDAWHVIRTADNVIHFVFYRERPVWLLQELDQKWGLPRNMQGTGMPPEEAYALRFPEPALLVQYSRDVAAAIVPRIEAMTDEFLQETTRLMPWGEITRAHGMGTSILTHGYQHLGQIGLARTLLGKQGIGT